MLSIPSSMVTNCSYISDGEAIYRRSFAIIRAESDLGAIAEDGRDIAVRMIHACGMVDLSKDIRIHSKASQAGRDALRRGASILCDSEMLARGITRKRLPADNQVKCLLNDPRAESLAKQKKTTRSAAAVDLWLDDLAGSVVVIGNAPTALFRLLEMLEEGAPHPALIIGIPVGFVGAVESKDELMRRSMSVPWITVVGRRGGSAIASAVINALAKRDEL